MPPLAPDNIRGAVRERYGEVAKSKNSGCGCSGSSCCGDSNSSAKAISMELGYSSSDVNQAPDSANMGLGCGNPRAIASLKPGETVLDLGSGGGFDCFLAANEVGETGQVIGVDMTPEMISKARANAGEAGYTNVEFRLGEIENLPVADGVVDVIISNCVINLSPEKFKVFQESFRVLKPNGRLAISDIVAIAELPQQAKDDKELFTSCISGAEPIVEIESMLKSAGFESIKINKENESKEFIQNWTPDSNIENFVVSATIEAIKPKA